jgi:sugar/nucleoside kinase (ribokinase family)/sugar phosphate isomerase/epimerase
MSRRQDTTSRTTMIGLILVHCSYLVLSLILINVKAADASILVVGSINADTFLPVVRLPTEGENLTLRPGCQALMDLPGGKGCTQAVAASKLRHATSSAVGSSSAQKQQQQQQERQVSFCGQFGNDSVSPILQEALAENHVDISKCGHHDDLNSGRGYVFITESGSVSAVVSGGSNTDGWIQWEKRWKGQVGGLSDNEVDDILDGIQYVMLQREVPEYVNLVLAKEAKRRGITVMLDVGGEDRSMSEEMLHLCDYLIPNESELNRLVASIIGEDNALDAPDPSMSADDEESLIVIKAKILQHHGAKNVLVTRGSKGCLLVTHDGTVLLQPACQLSPDQVIDETGAGDCFRAAFCVALLEEQLSLQECLAFASAAGACGVTKQGAVPATPTRQDVDRRYHDEMVMHIPRGGDKQHDFPFLFGSRLNSMKDRAELWDGPLTNPRDYVARQATIEGLTCVDFNYPQHFHSWTSQEAKQALSDAGLVAGAVCLRFPVKFARGAMNHPDSNLRREAIDMTKEAAQVARDLECNEVVVWSAYDGYDYPFQVDYDEKWSQLVEAFQECCDAFPDIRFSVEYKPTDENTRFFTIPSTGAAILMAKEVNRPNFGLTLDVGHMLMSGENPGQSIAMAGQHLFGIQLNDGYTRLAAEDGMMFGSIHPSMALEIMYQLRRVGFSGHFYFDTFPQRTDPVKEAEYNIRRVKLFWAAVARMDPDDVQRIATEHDALGALALVDQALRSL